MKVYMIYQTLNVAGYEDDFAQSKVVFSEEEGREAIPELVQGALRHIEKNSEAYSLAQENKIEVYRQIERFEPRTKVIEDLFFIKEIDPFYIEDHLFPVEIQEKMKLYALSLMKG